MSTLEIQDMLRTNAVLIRAIHENQNAGDLEQSTRYSARLQENLMKLAALADAQAQPSQALPTEDVAAGVGGEGPHQAPGLFGSLGSEGTWGPARLTLRDRFWSDGKGRSIIVRGPNERSVARAVEGLLWALGGPEEGCRGARGWSYLDPRGVSRGPFPAPKVAAWVRKGAFPDRTLAVRHDGLGAWIPAWILAELVEGDEGAGVGRTGGPGASVAEMDAEGIAPGRTAWVGGPATAAPGADAAAASSDVEMRDWEELAEEVGRARRAGELSGSDGGGWWGPSAGGTRCPAGPAGTEGPPARAAVPAPLDWMELEGDGWGANEEGAGLGVAEEALATSPSGPASPASDSRAPLAGPIHLVLVLDTSVLLSHLGFLERVTEELEGTEGRRGRPGVDLAPGPGPSPSSTVRVTALVPYVALCELDALKDGQRARVAARHSLRRLETLLAARDSRFRAQGAAEARRADEAARALGVGARPGREGSGRLANDDAVIACALAAGRALRLRFPDERGVSPTGPAVMILTHDRGMAIRARAAGLAAGPASRVPRDGGPGLWAALEEAGAGRGGAGAATGAGGEALAAAEGAGGEVVDTPAGAGGGATLPGSRAGGSATTVPRAAPPDGRPSAPGSAVPAAVRPAVTAAPPGAPPPLPIHPAPAPVPPSSDPWELLALAASRHLAPILIEQRKDELGEFWLDALSDDARPPWTAAQTVAYLGRHDSLHRELLRGVEGRGEHLHSLGRGHGASAGAGSGRARGSLAHAARALERAEREGGGDREELAVVAGILLGIFESAVRARTGGGAGSAGREGTGPETSLALARTGADLCRGALARLAGGPSDVGRAGSP